MEQIRQKEAVKLNEEQAAAVRRALESFGSDDNAFMRGDGYSEMKGAALAFVAGYLEKYNVPFTAVYNVVNEWCKKQIDKENNKQEVKAA